MSVYASGRGRGGECAERPTPELKSSDQRAERKAGCRTKDCKRPVWPGKDYCGRTCRDNGNQEKKVNPWPPWPERMVTTAEEYDHNLRQEGLWTDNYKTNQQASRSLFAKRSHTCDEEKENKGRSLRRCLNGTNNPAPPREPVRWRSPAQKSLSLPPRTPNPPAERHLHQSQNSKRQDPTSDMFLIKICPI